MRRMTIFVAVALFAAPVHAAPPDALEGADTGVTDSRDNNDGNPRLGLLGLLGLAGLLGLLRREPDIHIDARGDARNDKRS
jgi:MYXO-CTERM domain-containing protein